MAEERLIDDDKDKKYRIIKNEKGEDELVIDGTSDEENDDCDTGEATFEVPEFDEDDEDAAVLTPEQLAEKRLNAERERERRAKLLTDSIASATSDCLNEKFATALDSLDTAEEIEPENGEIHALKLLVYTRNCSEWEENAENAAKAAAEVGKFTSAERKSEILQMAKNGGIEQKIDELTQRVDKLSVENQAKKDERAIRFNADNKKALTFFCCTGVPFVVLLILAIYFSTIMYATQDGINIILTIVFASLALIFLIAFIFASRAFSTTSRRVRLNKRDTSTELGRTYLAEKEKLDNLNAIYAALKD